MFALLALGAAIEGVATRIISDQTLMNAITVTTEHKQSAKFQFTNALKPLYWHCNGLNSTPIDLNLPKNIVANITRDYPFSEPTLVYNGETRYFTIIFRAAEPKKAYIEKIIRESNLKTEDSRFKCLKQVNQQDNSYGNEYLKKLSKINPIRITQIDIKVKKQEFISKIF
ncbi:hypothetical protein N9W31_00730 [Litoricolaceae bacterium]|nr:hypothetical protein [Litorivicinaceae bacterium]